MIKKIASLNLSALKKFFPLIIFSILILSLVVCFVSWFVGKEKYIYYWDYSNYFSLYKELGAKFLNTPLKALDSIFISIRKADYNISGIVPLLPFYYTLGSNRFSYILSIALTYALPLIIGFPFFIEEIFGLKKHATRFERILLFFALSALIGLLPQLWTPILLGYIDIAGLAVIFFILYFYLRKNLSEQSLKELILIGVLLSALVIVRRWYAYWVVGFFFAAATLEIIKALNGSTKIQNFKTSFKKLLIIGLSALILFFALATKVALRMLTTDYSEIYSAFGSAGFSQDLEKFYAQYGLLTISLAVFGIITALSKKELRLYGIFFITLLITTFVIFTRTQSIDVHHYYWVTSILIIFAALFISHVFYRIKQTGLRVCFILALVAISFANFTIVFFKDAENILQPVSFALPKIRTYPKIRNDFEQIQQILLELDDLTRDTDKKIYVLSSSLSLNSSMLKNSCYIFEPELQKLDRKIFVTHDVDKRDGFPFQLLSADFIVTADPVGYHLSPKDQKVVTVLADQILNQKNIGQAYEKLPFETVLYDGRRVFLYKKTRKFSREELEKTSEMFLTFYPDNRTMFEINENMIKDLSEN